MNQTIKKCVILLLNISMLATLTGCQASSKVTPISRTGFFFDTVVTITLYDETRSELLDNCLQLCTDYEAKLSRTVTDSEISELNQAKGQPVTLSEDTVAIINDAIYYSSLSNGAFDITIGSVSSLWDFTGNFGGEQSLAEQSDTALIPPRQTSIEEQLPHVNYKNILINGHEVSLNDTETIIDLGGIAKGYIADCLKSYLLEQGVKHAIIDLGGNILTIGNKPDGTPYRIGIKKPFDENGSVITSVNITDQSVVTSGIYERCFTYEGRLYHHVLSPYNGYPVDNGLYSVTIVSDSSAAGDALSTACLVLGLKDGMALIESIPDIEALFITDQEELIYSSGFPISE